MPNLLLRREIAILARLQLLCLALLMEYSVILALNSFLPQGKKIRRDMDGSNFMVFCIQRHYQQTTALVSPRDCILTPLFS